MLEVKPVSQGFALYSPTFSSHNTEASKLLLIPHCPAPMLSPLCCLPFTFPLTPARDLAAAFGARGPCTRPSRGLPSALFPLQVGAARGKELSYSSVCIQLLTGSGAE